MRRVRRRFRGGIVWVTVGRDADGPGLAARIGEVIAAEAGGPAALDVTDSGRRETAVAATVCYSLDMLAEADRDRFFELGVRAPDRLGVAADRSAGGGQASGRRGPKARIMAATQPIPVGAPMRLTRNTRVSRSTPRIIPISVGSR